MTVILQYSDGDLLCDVAPELSPSEARWLIDRINPMLAELALKRAANRGIVAVAIPESA